MLLSLVPCLDTSVRNVGILLFVTYSSLTLSSPGTVEIRPPDFHLCHTIKPINEKMTRLANTPNVTNILLVAMVTKCTAQFFQYLGHLLLLFGDLSKDEDAATCCTQISNNVNVFVVLWNKRNFHFKNIQTSLLLKAQFK